MLYLCCALTIAIELVFFAANGYHRRQFFVVLCAAVNAATNLTMNLVYSGHRGPAVLLVLEAAVVLTEYAVYAAAYGRSGRLLLLTFLANLLSFVTGALLLGL